MDHIKDVYSTSLLLGWDLLKCAKERPQALPLSILAFLIGLILAVVVLIATPIGMLVGLIRKQKNML